MKKEKNQFYKIKHCEENVNKKSEKKEKKSKKDDFQIMEIERERIKKENEK
jgi:hypothetical protein